jgi:hypothetical protein
VPESGILIQSPAGFGRIAISVNEVQIQLDGTTFVQAEADDVMEVAVLQGNAQVIAEDTIRYVPAGAEVNIPMTNDLAPAGPPERPQPYEDTQVQELPVSNLETSVEIQPAIPVEVLYPPTATPAPVQVNGGVVQPVITFPPGINSEDITRTLEVITLTPYVIIDGCPEFCPNYEATATAIAIQQMYAAATAAAAALTAAAQPPTQPVITGTPAPFE